ncbi:MAG TPA: phosphatase domain-containing protein [Gemmatimonadales bacterium]|nr:phosphatase domain-containing protein [Gemmatimonadales bacterium]
MSSTDWRGELFDLAGQLGRRLKYAADRLERRLDKDPYCIVGYRSYGTADRALVLGRVLEDEGRLPPDPSHSPLRNLIDAIKRIESDPLPLARVEARLAGSVHAIEADGEGFVRSWLPSSAAAAPGWIRAELSLAEGAPVPARPGVAEILVPPAEAAFAVVSDLDDTVLQSDVTRLVRAARLVLLENARTRLPFPGAAAFYRALAGGTASTPLNPIFYVSKSPWNLYEVVSEFLALQQLPAGPVLLRDWDLGLPAPARVEHKIAAIGEILATYPNLPFILIGDSGQKDPEIYRALLQGHPGRISAIYIRNVNPNPERLEAIRELAAEVSAAGSALVLADDTLAAARHAAEHGWIDPARLDDIAGDKQADEGATAEKVAPPGTSAPATGPTVVVE